MKNRIARVTLLGAIGLSAAGLVLLVSGARSGHLTLTLPVEHTAEFADEHLPLFPSPLHVRGHQLVNSADEVVLLRGVMPPDPAVLDERGRFNRDFFSRIRRTNSNVIRLPVHPEEWVGDQDYLWRYLDPLVSWAGGGSRPQGPGRTRCRARWRIPASGGGTLAFAVAEFGPAESAIFSVDGRRGRTLGTGRREAGMHRVTWSGEDSAHNAVAPGVYFVRLTTAEREFTRRLVYLR